MKSNHKEKLLYLFFGFLTTVISIAVFAFFTEVLQIDSLISNIISWIFAVAFAFVTNRKWVFSESGQSFIVDALYFYLARLTTLVFEEAVIFVFITLLDLNALVVKAASQIAVIILNYLISKFVVFRK
ncbi:MAG: GtrA family protein [Clostridia bacterium]|nr:GtrA family protein [Clostridia bacterium]